MGNTITYRLINKNKLNSWSIKDGVTERNGKLESIHYRPGATSIFDSDNKNNPIQPEWVTFTYNENPDDPACEIVVPVQNQLLIDFLESLWYFNKVYKRHDPEAIHRNKAEEYGKIEQALKLITESDEIKTQAIALAILGFDYFNASHSKCVADLKGKAIRNPDTIIAAFKAEDYESKYIASLAYCKGVIKSNDTHTAVIWADGQGKIISIAPGENPVDKLAEFIREGSDAAETLLQEIGNRLEAETIQKNIAENPEVVAAMEKRIKELEAQLAKQTKVNEPKEDPVDDIKELRELYKQTIGKNPPPNMVNNKEWMKAKIAEAKQE